MIISDADQKFAEETIKELLCGAGDPNSSSFVRYIVDKQNPPTETTHPNALDQNLKPVNRLLPLQKLLSPKF